MDKLDIEIEGKIYKRLFIIGIVAVICYLAVTFLSFAVPRIYILDKNTGKVIGKSIDVSGNYEKTYSWITSSGTRKTTTRVLKVLPKVIPKFKTKY